MSITLIRAGERGNNVAKKKVTALASRSAAPTALVAQAESSINEGLKALAVGVTLDLAPRDQGLILTQLRSWDKTLKTIEGLLKKRVIEFVKTKGHITTEKGSMGAEADGLQFEIRPYRSGLDPKKLEALIRAKSLDPAKFMDTTVTYSLSVDEMKQRRLKAAFTEAELEAAIYDESWTVQTPKVKE
jgi:hypothetical protein